ncbi:MAG: pseudouridine synthase [Opitutales bacterium]
MHLRVLYRDDDYIAVDKAAGLLVHRSPLDASERVFALQLVRDQLGQAVFPCHRLDRPTSGVLLFALNAPALRFTQKEFAQQGCDKSYEAVVRGWTQEAAAIDYPLRSEEAPDKVRSALTFYRTINRCELAHPVGPYQTARFSHIQLEPKTGRKHQLRRHMAHLRHPILGDTRHGDGAQNRFLREHGGCQMLMLRATQLCFTHYRSRQRVTIPSGRDEAFDRILQSLQFSLPATPT